MTERLAEIGARIDGVRQLGTVVGAMRGIAAARVQQSRNQLAAVDAYQVTIATAIGRALAWITSDRPRAGRAVRPALVLFCAEQGFAGAFTERVLDAAGADLTGSELFLVGTRGISVAAEREVAPGWTGGMPSRSAGIPRLADHIVRALYARIAVGKIDRLDMIFSRRTASQATRVERRHLFPFDLTVFPCPSDRDAPLLSLTPDALLDELTADYMHAELCEAALHAFAAENEARMEAMAAASKQVDRTLSSLQAQQRLVRQEEITAEVIELSAGEAASRFSASRTA